MGAHKKAMNLFKKKCVPCADPSLKPLGYLEIKKLREEVPTWQVIEEYKIWRLVKNYNFKDFSEVMKFVNKIAEIAEVEGHHPNIYIHDWNKVKLELYTHTLRGLHENDFILASKIDRL